MTATLDQAPGVGTVSPGLVLNVGGGSKGIPLPAHYEGWEHVLLDVTPRPDVDVVMDARLLELWERDLPKFDAVYCSHNLEHYYTHDVASVLRGMFAVLRPGGVVEIHVPDLAVVARALAGGAGLYDVAYHCGGGTVLWHDMLYGMSCEIRRSGEGWAHRTGFTEARLRRVLLDAGFTRVQTATPVNEYELAMRAIRPA
jgi:SAM-dependent methyltransferase